MNITNTYDCFNRVEYLWLLQLNRFIPLLELSTGSKNYCVTLSVQVFKWLRWIMLWAEQNMSNRHTNFDSKWPKSKTKQNELITKKCPVKWFWGAWIHVKLLIFALECSQWLCKAIERVVKMTIVMTNVFLMLCHLSFPNRMYMFSCNKWLKLRNSRRESV